MSCNTSNTQRIAKNTVVLYIRMAFIMCITLFTSRIVLQALGVADFGLYSVVAGVVGLISFLRTSLTSSTQRFISYELGTGNDVHLRKVFSVCVSSHVLIALIIFIVAETLGVWFLNSYVQIPADRLTAANWIFQFAIVSLCAGTITVPFSADVISHEEMTCYAVITMVEAVLKLVIAYALFISQTDRLILYGALMACIDVFDFCMYFLYCRFKYKETKYKFYYDKPLFKRVFSFSGWTILGQMSVVAANQGTSVLVNMYYSVVANAAIGIAQQVNNALSGLTANFQTAFQPQITKSYATKNYDYLNSLICSSSKISFFLVFIVSIPVVLNIDFILDIWLNDVPTYAGSFCIWFISITAINALYTPLVAANYATGNVKWFQICLSLSFLLFLLVTYLIFDRCDVAPTIAFIVKLLFNIFNYAVSILFVKTTIQEFSVNNYINKVVLRVVLVILLSGIIGYVVFAKDIFGVNDLIKTLLTLSSAAVIVFYFGFSSNERRHILNMLLKKEKQ